jgi:DNA polymerase-3 subunit gamma/tau
MGQALYRKYRSKSFDEIVGQDHITDTLAHAIEKQRVSHAYLFTGPRGVGKTSVARILAHQLNGVPYVGEDSHLDIIEIDAASTGGVDEVRELREKVYIAPASGKYKVYIIDEVHMMSTAAFNALLKTLEEPPAHAIFILATTEAHRLPATIISRTQRYNFRPISPAQIVEHLRDIAVREKINISDDALMLIAEHSEGSFRDSISMLDQASSLHKKIDRSELEVLLGIPPAAATAKLIADIQGHDAHSLVSNLTSLRNDGYQAAAIAKQLSQALRVALLENQLSAGRQQVLTLLGNLIDVSASHSPDQLLELILLGVALDMPNAETKFDPKNETHDQVPDAVQTNKPAKIPTPPIANQPKASVKPSKPDKAKFNKGQDEIKDFTVNDEQWQAALEILKQQYNTLYGIMKLGRVEFLPGKVVFTFGYVFHQKRANDAKNRDIVASVLKEVTSQPIAIECLYEKNSIPPLETPNDLSGPNDNQNMTISSLDTISNIFGGGELLES